jgi:hypothetical protein
VSFKVPPCQIQNGGPAKSEKPPATPQRRHPERYKRFVKMAQSVAMRPIRAGQLDGPGGFEPASGLRLAAALSLGECNPIPTRGVALYRVRERSVGAEKIDLGIRGDQPPRQ